MSSSLTPFYMRRKRWSGKGLIWSAQLIITIFRAIFRILEHIGPRNRRERLRQLRGKLDAIAFDGNAAIKQIQIGNVFEGLIGLTERFSKYGSSEDQAGMQATSANLRAMRQEMETLKAIYAKAGENKSLAIAGFQEYIKAYPQSHSAYSYLGIARNQMDDVEGSIAAYQEAIRLAGENSLPAASSRLQLGEVLRQKVDKQAGIVEFRRVIDEATPTTESMVCLAYLHLGSALNEIGERQEARSAWYQAIKWDNSRFIAKKARELLQQNP
jgi:tetratricopeptide (TPR) repeat protein